MPLAYHINTDDGLITVQGAGAVDIEEFRRLGETLLEDHRYDPSLPQLVDLRGLRPAGPASAATDLALSELLGFLQQRYRARVAADVAVVIDEHLETRHCADIYLLTCAIQMAELFADYDLALRWLMRRAFADPVADTSGSAEEQDAGGDDADRAPE